MMMQLRIGIALVGLITAVISSQPASAQDRQLSFSITGGPKVLPSYFGADDLSLGSFGVGGSVGFNGLRFGDFELGDPDIQAILLPGTGLRGSFRLIQSRKGEEELEGLDNINTAFEAGVHLHHTTETWQIYTDVRYGVVGHSAFAGEVGANVIYRSGNGLTLHAGPRAEFGTGRFMRTYFGVTPEELLRAAEIGNTRFSDQAFRPSGGFYSVGVELGGYQALSQEWGVSGSIRFDRLRGDAANSPIVQQGSRDQVSAQIGLTRHFNFRF